MQSHIDLCMKFLSFPAFFFLPLFDKLHFSHQKFEIKAFIIKIRITLENDLYEYFFNISRHVSDLFDELYFCCISKI